MIERARRLRKTVEALAETLEDENALKSVELFPAWKVNTWYEIGERVRHDGVLYKCISSHTSQSDWVPTDSISLWARVLIPDPEIIPEWEQPDSTNPYMKGDKVRHIGTIWISDIDYNVFEPGVAGWSEVI